MIQNYPPHNHSTFWQTPKGTFSKVALVVAPILLVIGVLVLTAALLPHTSLGIFFLKAFSTVGSKIVMAGLFTGSAGLVTTVVLLYVHYRKTHRPVAQPPQPPQPPQPVLPIVNNSNPPLSQPLPPPLPQLSMPPSQPPQQPLAPSQPLPPLPESESSSESEDSQPPTNPIPTATVATSNPSEIIFIIPPSNTLSLKDMTQKCTSGKLKNLMTRLKDCTKENPFKFTIEETPDVNHSTYVFNYCAWMADGVIYIRDARFMKSPGKMLLHKLEISKQGEILSFEFGANKVEQFDQKQTKILEALIEKCTVDSKSEVPDVPIPVIYSLEEQELTNKDLCSFRAALYKDTTTIISYMDKSTNQQTDYVVWFNKKFGAINIQDSNSFNNGLQTKKLGININIEGKILSIWLNGICSNAKSIPIEFLPLVQHCLKEALKFSSDYKPTGTPKRLEIKLIRRGLKQVPEYHLQFLSQFITKTIKNTPDPKLQVLFMDDDMSTSQGIDAGGLSRDYLDELFAGLMLSSIVHFEAFNGNYLPTAKVNSNGTAVLSIEEQTIFYQMGILLMYCYRSTNNSSSWNNICSIGQYFPEEMFAAISALSAKDLNATYAHLSSEKKLNMVFALAKGQEVFIDFIKKPEKNKIVEIATKLHQLGQIPEKYLTKTENAETINFSKLELKDLEGLVKQMLFDFYEPKLEAIFVIAQGMKSILPLEKPLGELFKKIL